MIKLAYQNGTNPVEEATFAELRIFENPETVRSEGETLRGVLYNHRISSRRVFTLEISKDMPTTDVLWIREFWSADRTWISDPLDPTVDVEGGVPAGVCPIAYTEGVLQWPEVTLELKAKYPTV